MSEELEGEREVPLKALLDAFAVRARAYAHIFDVLSENFGAARAVDLLAEATHRLGEANGAALAKFAPGDVSGLKAAFLCPMPVPDATFKPEVLREDGDRLDIQFHGCPLVATWKEMGRSDEDIELLCQGARAVDHGLLPRRGSRSQAKAGSGTAATAAGSTSPRAKPLPESPKSIHRQQEQPKCLSIVALSSSPAPSQERRP